MTVGSGSAEHSPDGRRVILSLSQAGAELLRHKADVRAQQLSSAPAAAAPSPERLSEAF